MSILEQSAKLESLTPMSLEEASRICFLDSGKLRFLKAGAILRLTIADDKSYLKTIILRTFPLTHPDQYLSVKDDGGNEVGIIRSLAGLDSDSRRLVEEELKRRYFLPVIRQIHKVVERFGVLEWHVDTEQGPYRFTTRDIRESVLRLGGDRYILSDVDENRYEIPDAARLDSKSAASLFRHL